MRLTLTWKRLSSEQQTRISQSKGRICSVSERDRQTRGTIFHSSCSFVYISFFGGLLEVGEQEGKRREQKKRREKRKKRKYQGSRKKNFFELITREEYAWID